jgi:hypothetical protein
MVSKIIFRLVVKGLCSDSNVQAVKIVTTDTVLTMTFKIMN